MIQPALVTVPVHSNQPQYLYLVAVLMHSNRVIIFSLLQNVHSAHSVCKMMKQETKTRGRELPGMEALSFTVLVAHDGVGVATTGCGGRHWFSFFFPLLRCAIFFLCFFVPLLTVFLPLCSNFVAVRLVLVVSLVATKRRTGRGTWRMLLRFFSVFFSSCSCLLLVFLFSIHSTLSLPLLAFFFFFFPSVSPLSFSIMSSFSPSLCLLLLCSTLFFFVSFSFFGFYRPKNALRW